MLANCWRDEKTFKLRGALLASKPLDGSTADTKIYLGEHIPGVDPDKLAYFGASVFWRGAARAWKIDQVKVPRLPSNRYEELFRLFLLDKGPERILRQLVKPPSKTENACSIETLRRGSAENPFRI